MKRKIMPMVAVCLSYIQSGFNIFHGNLYPKAWGEEVTFMEAQKIQSGTKALDFLLQLQTKVSKKLKITEADIVNLTDAINIIKNDIKNGKIAYSADKIVEAMNGILLLTRDNRIREPLENFIDDLTRGKSKNESYSLTPTKLSLLTSGTVTNNFFYIGGLDTIKTLQVLSLGYNTEAMFKPDTFPATRLNNYGSMPDQLAFLVAHATYSQSILHDMKAAIEDGNKLADALESYAKQNRRGALLGDFVQAGSCQTGATLDNCQPAKDFIAKLRTGDITGAFGILPKSSTLATDYANYLIPVATKIASNVFIMNFEQLIMIQLDSSIDKIAGNIQLANPKKLGFIPIAFGPLLRWGAINYTETTQTVTLNKDGTVQSSENTGSQNKSGLGYIIGGLRGTALAGVTPKFNLLLDAEVTNVGAGITITPLTVISEEKKQEVGWGYRSKGVPALALLVDGITFSSEFMRRFPGYEKLEASVNQGIIRRISINDFGMSLRIRGTYEKGRINGNLEIVPFFSVLNGDPQAGLLLEPSIAAELGRNGRTKLVFKGDLGITTLGYLLGGGTGLQIDMKKFGLDLVTGVRYYNSGAQGQLAGDEIAKQLAKPFVSGDGGVIELNVKLGLRF